MDLIIAILTLALIAVCFEVVYVRKKLKKLEKEIHTLRFPLD